MDRILNFKNYPQYAFQGPRLKRIGIHSGEEFREEILFPFIDSLKKGEKGTINFEGVKVFSPSFLDEVFAGDSISQERMDKIKDLSLIGIPSEWWEFIRRRICLRLERSFGSGEEAEKENPLRVHLAERRMLNFQRLAGSKKIRSYNLAEHSYFVALLFQELAKAFGVEYDVDVLSAVLRHDFMEVFTTDLPYQVKNLNEETKTAWDIIEYEARKQAGDMDQFLFTDNGLMSILNPEQYLLLKECDLLELALFCKEEMEMGNTSQDMKVVLERIRNVIDSSRSLNQYTWGLRLFEIFQSILV